MRSRADHRRHRARGSASPSSNAELARARPRLPPALLAVGRVVHARRRAGHRDPVLPRAPAAREARARADAGSRRRRSRIVPARSCATRPGTPSTTPTSCGAGRRGGACSAIPATEYPEYYTPKPYSKSFVQHLDHWYAQSHPDEDFAETFAVWLDPTLDVGDALRRLAGAAEARIHGSADARARVARGRASRRSARSIRCRG